MSQRVFAVLSAGSSVVLACMLLVIGAGTGCGRTGLDDYATLPDGGPEPSPDGDLPDVGPEGCDSASCTTGCCDATGQCVSGRAATACGTMGHACVDCQADGFQYCDGTTRACASNVGPCSPQTCPSGCCVGNTCFSGTALDSCGSGGQACQTCGAKGRACVNRQCTTMTCGPGNCAGCCLGNVCLSGTDQTACGQAGFQCTNCAASGGKCSARDSSGGSCIASSCNATNCAGCCDGNGQCQSGFAQTTCGTRGQSCINCSQFNGKCIGQQCTPPPPPTCARWNCVGCCDTAGNCQVGIFDNQCGSSGASCFSCQQVGEKCLNQQCAKPPPACNAMTCNPGCCDAQGRCQPGFSDATCGDFGNACQSCLQFGEACLNQQCNFVPDAGVCNAQTCPFGCCDGFGQCQPGFFQFACGNFGDFCRSCGQSGETCSNQQCVFPDSGFCNANTCKGCCDQFNNCQPGGSAAQCGSFGNFCQNCAQFGETCSGGGLCMSPPPTCPQTCTGCCDSGGRCQGGFVDKQCGEQGGSCTDCTALVPSSTCDVNVVPRRCTSLQMTCPAPYVGCPAGLLQPPTLQQKGACSSTDLQNAASACSLSAHSTGCNSFLSFEQTQNPSCGNCLVQFAFDFSEESGVLACVAPVVDATCNHNSACITDCTNAACAGCLDPGATTMCETSVRTGACQGFYGSPCLSTALTGAGAVCDPSKYANFGAWLQGVGNQYCR